MVTSGFWNVSRREEPRALSAESKGNGKGTTSHRRKVYTLIEEIESEETTAKSTEPVSK